MVYSPSLDGDIRFGTSSSVLLPDFPEDPDLIMEVVNLVAEDGVASRGVLYRRRGRTVTAAAHLMHPRADHSQNYVAAALVQAGFDVLARASRWVNNDTYAVHETLLLDMAAGVTFLRTERGYSDVALVGNSGGGTLAAYYQQQAEIAPPGRLRTTPAGDELDLNAFTMPAASALVLIGAHLGEGRVLALTHPAVMRAALIHALGASATAFWRIDVAPLSRLILSRHGGSWRLQALEKLAP